MNEDQVSTAIARLFDEGYRIIFWNDPDREFEDGLDSLDLGKAMLIRIDNSPKLETKIRIERQEPQQNFVLYSTSEVPAPPDDWLLDIRLYSRTFRADRASIVHGELGLLDQSVRDHLKLRAKFLASKDRVGRLKRLIHETDRAADVDRKMLAVIARVEQPDVLNIVTALMSGAFGEGLQTESEIWLEVEKFDLSGSFWAFAKTEFGYEDLKPSLRGLLVRLFVTDFAHCTTADIPPALQHLCLPRNRWPNAAVCLAQWRDSHTRSEAYDYLSNLVADSINLAKDLPSMSMESLLDVKTFEVVEKYVAIQLRDRIVETKSAIKPADVKAIALRRRDGYWADPERGGVVSHRKALHAVYEALVASADLFDLRNAFGDGFVYPNAKAMFDAYASDLWRFDRLYRDFVLAADKAESEGWDILKELRASVEECYVNWFLLKISQKWGTFLEGGLLADWRIDGIRNQQRFFEAKVAAALEESAKRVFVVISDAFRYEAGKELIDDLNGRFRVNASIEPMLGVLPSYTALGMAALLPHKTLTYPAAAEPVLVDGSSSIAPNRSGILATRKGIAVKADEIREMKKEDGRELVRPFEIVYIYHNVIDARGDSASTEGETFEAVSQAVREIADLVKKTIIDKLNGSVVFVTADHGFLFQESRLDLTDKNALKEKPPGTLIAKKRYLLGRNLPKSEMAYRGETSITSGAEGGVQFWVPKGNNRFHFVGGSRFVHGGAMLQEIVVPVVTVREQEGASREKTRTTHVPVTVLGQTHKITTNRWAVELLQTEKVTDRRKAVTLDIAVYDGATAITNIERMTFDSTSDVFEERKRRISLSLEQRTYDKKKPYYLVLRNVLTEAEEERVEVSINIAFMDEF
jgi:uncharacterized protein (TIGR02687 family)